MRNVTHRRACLAIFPPKRRSLSQSEINLERSQVWTGSGAINLGRGQIDEAQLTLDGSGRNQPWTGRVDGMWVKYYASGHATDFLSFWAFTLRGVAGL